MKSQRNLMRDLNIRFQGDKRKIVRSYANAERKGKVQRASNMHDIEPERYAEGLLRDGVRNGWL